MFVKKTLFIITEYMFQGGHRYDTLLSMSAVHNLPIDFGKNETTVVLSGADDFSRGSILVVNYLMMYENLKRRIVVVICIY